MAECKQCGGAVPDDASFCPSCGAPQLDGAAVTPTGAVEQGSEGDAAAEAAGSPAAEQAEVVEKSQDTERLVAADAAAADGPVAEATDASMVSEGAGVADATVAGDPLAEATSADSAAETVSEELATGTSDAASPESAAEPVGAAAAAEPTDVPGAAQPAAPVPPATLEAASAGAIPAAAPAAPQTAPAPASAPASAPGGPAPAPAPVPAPEPEPNTPPVDWSYGNQSPATPDVGLMPQGQPRDPRSPLKRAWADFKTSPGHWSMPAKLALLQLVPIAGVVAATGYIQQWGAEQAFGRRDPLPTRIVRPGVLEAGFNATLTNCVLGAVMFCINFVLDGLTSRGVTGDLISLAFELLLAPLFAIMTLRSAICWRVKPGLSVSRAWKMLTTRGKTGPLFTAVLVPSLIMGVIVGVAAFVLVSIVTMRLSASMAAYSMVYDYYYGDLYVVLLNELPVILFNIVVFVLIFLFFANVAGLVSTRAVGYWMRDFAPETWQEYQEGAKADIANHPLGR